MESKITNTDFKNKEIIVGLDVHMNTWHATIIVEEVMKSKSFVADTRKFAEYLEKTYPNGNYLVGYEAGCFGFWIKEQLEEQGVRTIVINPADIPTTDKDKRKKTDKVDSKKIALSIKGGMIKAIYAPNKKWQEIRALSRRRYDLTKKITRVKNQIKGTMKYYGILYPEEYEDSRKHWSKSFLQWLSTIQFETIYGKMKIDSYLRELSFMKEEQIIIIKQLKEVLKLEVVDKQYKILRGIPGVGLVTAMTMLAEIIEINRFKTRDEFLSFVGLSPTEHSSGEIRKIGHLTKRCNSTIRTMLIESSWIAIRKDPAMTLYYNDMYKKKGKQKSIIKVAKKLATRIRFLLINNCEYVMGVTA